MENIKKVIEDLEKVSILLEKAKHFNLLQEDYIDFYESTIGEDDITNALLTLHEIERTKDEHITLSYEIDDKIKEASNIINANLSKLYKLSNEEVKTEA